MTIQPKFILIGLLLLTSACEQKTSFEPKEEDDLSSGTVIRPHKATDQQSLSLNSSESAASNDPLQIALTQKYLEGKWTSQHSTCSKDWITIDSRGEYIDEFGGGIFHVLGKNRLSIGNEGGETIYQTKVISKDEFLATDIGDGRKTTYKRCSQKITSPQEITSSENVLIAKWEALNGDCRGGLGDNPDTLKACELRDNFEQQLVAKNLCYGKVGQAGYQMKWHKCGSSSVR
jgi:hypothetical protein